jgi:hypothetical protein
LIILFCRLRLLTTIFPTLIFLIGGDFAVAKNQLSSASLGDLCALAVNSSSSRTTTGPVSQIIPTQTQTFTVNDRLTTDTYDAMTEGRAFCKSLNLTLESYPHRSLS